MIRVARAAAGRCRPDGRWPGCDYAARQRPPKNPLGHTAHLAEPQEEDFLPSRIRPPLGAKLRSAQLGLERICHMVDIAGTQPGVIQAETDRMLGELVRVVDVRFLTVLDTVEPFLLGGGDERAVDEHRGGGLVIYRVDSENVHRPTSSHVVYSALRLSATERLTRSFASSGQ